MAQNIFTALLAAWLTGMIPMAVWDICHDQPYRCGVWDRIIIYPFWPLLALLYRIDYGRWPAFFTAAWR